MPFSVESVSTISDRQWPISDTYGMVACPATEIMSHIMDMVSMRIFPLLENHSLCVLLAGSIGRRPYGTERRSLTGVACTRYLVSSFYLFIRLSGLLCSGIHRCPICTAVRLLG